MGQTMSYDHGWRIRKSMVHGKKMRGAEVLDRLDVFVIGISIHNDETDLPQEPGLKSSLVRSESGHSLADKKEPAEPNP